MPLRGITNGWEKCALKFISPSYFFYLSDWPNFHFLNRAGESYHGTANRGESGDSCVPWDTPELSFVLDDDKIPNLGPLEGNNFCRNPDGDSSPWCIAPNGEFDYCDIPSCEEATNESMMATNEVDVTAFETEARKCEGWCAIFDFSLRNSDLI